MKSSFVFSYFKFRLYTSFFLSWKLIHSPHLFNQIKFLSLLYLTMGTSPSRSIQYYGHRNKFKLVGREDELEKQNRVALKMAREVADETGTLMCGDLSNTFVYQPGDEEAIATTKAMFKVNDVKNINILTSTMFRYTVLEESPWGLWGPLDGLGGSCVHTWALLK